MSHTEEIITSSDFKTLSSDHIFTGGKYLHCYLKLLEVYCRSPDFQYPKRWVVVKEFKTISSLASIGNTNINLLFSLKGKYFLALFLEKDPK